MADITLDDFIQELGLENSPALDRAMKEAQLQLPLAALRKASGLTQSEMASKLNKTQAAVSKFEGRGDFLCSTLYSYAHAVGADVRTNIRVKGKVFDVVATKDEDSLYFSLKERLAVCENVLPEKAIGNFLEIARASDKRRNTVANTHVEWGHAVVNKQRPLLSKLLNKLSPDENGNFANTA